MQNSIFITIVFWVKLHKFPQLDTCLAVIIANGF
jgi:hypothetical protein